MIKSNKRNIIIALLSVVLMAIVLDLTGIIGFCKRGIAHIANDAEHFSDLQGHIIEGDYSVSIDLSNLESNIGKELYNDGTHKIYVSFVDDTGDINTGGYRIGFRASGQYSLSKATLISGVHNITLGQNLSTMNWTAKMTAEYKGIVYDSPVFGGGSLNYKDGSQFSFYIFPTEAYEMNQVALNEKGIVNLTITNLYKNIWIKK